MTESGLSIRPSVYPSIRPSVHPSIRLSAYLLGVLTLLSATALAGAFILLAAGVDPVPGYFYVFAWYPTIVLIDALAHRADGRALVLANRPAVLSLWLWSVPVWLFFEAANFRLENWYYVFVPRNQYQRWAGVVLAFATVLPALFFAERLLDAMGVGRKWRTRPFTITRAGLWAIVALGIAMLALPLAWPRVFFPYIWGAMWALCEPYVYRKRPDLSLFADLERGELGRTGRLLIGGAGIGLLWEFFNFWARAKWIYTVPLLEDLKLFEMPLLGFIGFPFFALEAWAMYHALCAAGVAIPLSERRVRRPVITAVAAAVTALLAHQVMGGIDDRTVSSVAPFVEDLRVTPPEAARLKAAGFDVYGIARAEPTAVGAVINAPPDRASSLVKAAQLVILRGIGPDHVDRLLAMGVRDVCTLAGLDAEAILNTLERIPGAGQRPTPGEVRVWLKAAVRECVS